MLIPKIREIVEYNQQQIEQNHEGNQVHVVSEGIEVTNPFIDETGRFDVDPFVYYGIDFVTRFVELYDQIKKTEKMK